MQVTLQDICAALGGVLHGAPDLVIDRLASLESAEAASLSFVAQARYASQIASTAAGALIVPPALLEQAAARGACIETPDPYLYFARLTQWWKAQRERAELDDAAAAIHPSAVIHPGARLGSGVTVGAFAVIEAGVTIADGARIGAHCVLERRSSVGAGTRLAPHVTLGHDCAIGSGGIVHAGTVIGADGFGFAPHQGEWIKIICVYRHFMYKNQRNRSEMTCLSTLSSWISSEIDRSNHFFEL